MSILFACILWCGCKINDKPRYRPRVVYTTPNEDKRIFHYYTNTAMIDSLATLVFNNLTDKDWKIANLIIGLKDRPLLHELDTDPITILREKNNYNINELLLREKSNGAIKWGMFRAAPANMLALLTDKTLIVEFFPPGIPQPINASEPFYLVVRAEPDTSFFSTEYKDFAKRTFNTQFYN